jgi:hypothetical protein
VQNLVGFSFFGAWVHGFTQRSKETQRSGLEWKGSLWAHWANTLAGHRRPHELQEPHKKRLRHGATRAAPHRIVVNGEVLNLTLETGLKRD